MESSSLSSILCFFIVLLTLFFHPCRSTTNTLIIHHFSEQRPSTLYLGDSLVIRNKLVNNLYLFHDRRAFDLCLFSEATLVFDVANVDDFKWQPTRPGFYYFSSKDKSTGSCLKDSKVPVRVISPQPYPSFSPAAAPTPVSGGDFPAFPWQSRWGSNSPAPDISPLLPRSYSPSSAPTASPNGIIPFISSSPAVPVPAGETDTATIKPLYTPAAAGQQMMTGLASAVKASLALVIFFSAFQFWL